MYRETCKNADSLSNVFSLKSDDFLLIQKNVREYILVMTS